MLVFVVVIWQHKCLLLKLPIRVMCFTMQLEQGGFYLWCKTNVLWQIRQPLIAMGMRAASVDTTSAAAHQRDYQCSTQLLSVLVPLRTHTRKHL